ncbi:MAG: septation protein A [Pseudomonadota bacterium]
MNDVPDAPVEQAAKKDLPPLLKLALELGPLGIFFFANARGESLAGLHPSLQGVEPIFIATGAFMIAITLSLGISYSLVRHIPIMPLISGVVVIIFGALTLWLQNELFIKLKPTIVNILFGSILLGGLYFGRPLLRYLFDTVFALDEEGWRKLTFRWGAFFFFLALVNEFVWRTFTTDQWVAFKTFGILPMTLIFTFAQVPLIQRHSTEEPDEESGGSGK